MLEDLWLNDNYIQDAEAMREDLAGQEANLACIYLSANPIEKQLGSHYKQWLQEILPRLQQIDADIVR